MQSFKNLEGFQEKIIGQKRKIEQELNLYLYRKLMHESNTEKLVELLCEIKKLENMIMNYEWSRGIGK